MTSSPSRRADIEHLIVVAASAGGISALQKFVSGLPAEFPAAIAVVQHLHPRHPSFLVDILLRCSSLPVTAAVEGERLRNRSIFVAPPDHHLLVNMDGTLSLSGSELVHFVRPSADVLFASAARAFGARVIAVVLTGSGVDGTMGVRAVKSAGGTVFAQDEASSEYFGMPGSAITTGGVDFILPLNEIAPAIVGLIGGG